MDLEYDRKFEEMKKYIPFLESMIKRLKNTSSTSPNPRQAQLDKIRSLRDLLQDKKKRMKMENLLKCEQVLVNLYAKIDQRDTLPGINKPYDTLPSSNTRKSPDLTSIRNKLKTVVDKLQRRDQETLPEIARASEIEEICTPGSKEPALFQRRPNKASLSPTTGRKSEISPQDARSKRAYTRVLVSPERDDRRWTNTAHKSPDKLYCRRSPRRSPRRISPSYKKERKKSLSSQSRKKPRDLNITLDVPEESLGSLQTKDIVSRIINCDDNDVDINTLRELKSKILNELKQTGASEDISELILKSYKKKKKKTKTKNEMEEGEISDSESEIIENVYGNLVIMNKDQNSLNKKEPLTKETDKQRKIQICLVYNADTEKTTDKEQPSNVQVPDITDFESYDQPSELKASSSKSVTNQVNDIPHFENADQTLKSVASRTKSELSNTKNSGTGDEETACEIITIDDEDNINRKTVEVTKDISNESFKDTTKENCSVKLESKESTQETAVAPFKPNFYKPLIDSEQGGANSTKNSSNEIKPFPENSTSENDINLGEKNEKESNKDKQLTAISKIPEIIKHIEKDSNGSVSKAQDNIDIPLLNTEPVNPTLSPKQVVSEIDILQALKNDILNETLGIPGTEVSTPLLHQPKVTKVASAHEIVNKKRISIEKYKEKVVAPDPTSKPSLFPKKSNISLQKEEHSKKQSLKLTEKECERFNFPAKLALDESSDEGDNNEPHSPVGDLYADLVPKSPEMNEGPVLDCPIIIPAEPVKTTVSSKSDVDMRTMMPLLSPKSPRPSPNFSTSTVGDDSLRNEKRPEPYRPPLVDPRLRVESPNPNLVNPERTPRPLMYPNMTPNRNPNMTPNHRSFDMTPSHQPFEFDDSSSRKHVYAPFVSFESRDRGTSVTREIPKSNWEPSIDKDLRKPWAVQESRDHDQKENSVQRDSDYQRSRKPNNDRYKYDSRDEYSYNRQDCPRTPVHSFGRLDSTASTATFGRMDTPMTPVNNFARAECPSTPSHQFGRADLPHIPGHPYGRSDLIQTPTHSFGRSECPSTPSHPFGRAECLTTPNRPYVRADCPATPSHPFGRVDCPSTPSHPFGRTECPTTPSHPFGRTETPTTPNHSFGRSEYSHKNPNIGQKFIKDPRIHRNTEYESRSYNFDHKQKDRRNTDVTETSFNRSDSYNNHSREQSIGRSERSVRPYERDNSVRREHSVNREQLYIQERHSYNRSRYEEEETRYTDVESRRNHQPEFRNRTMTSNENNNRTSRAQSIGRNFRDTMKENTLAVKPQTGHTFTIDTSVNRTFQEFLNKKGIEVSDYTPFNARRQRAASVGRALLPDPPNVNRLTSAPHIARMSRESSVGRAIAKGSSNESFDSKRNRYTRARSVGRDLTDFRHEKSFIDIKAEFRTYSKNMKIDLPKRDYNINENKSTKYHHSRKDSYENQPEKRDSGQALKSTYSPRKNYRDPRMRREQAKESYRKTSNDNRHMKNYGIVYSNANIAQGTILGSGYGVKNYKIPKIRRAPEEKSEPESTPVTKDKKDSKNITEQKSEKISKRDKDTRNHSDKDRSHNKKKNDSNDKRSIKSSSDSKSKIKVSESEVVMKSKKVKKIILLSDSESDSDTKIKHEEVNTKSVTAKSVENKESNKVITNEVSNKIDNESNEEVISEVIQESVTAKSSESNKEINRIITNEVSNKIDNESNKDINPEVIQDHTKTIVQTSENPIDKETIPLSNSKEIDKIQDELLDDSFGIDDLTMFPDNLESDQVMDNINALIADLDNEIDDSKDKNSQFTNEINIEKMLENIETSIDGTKGSSVEESLKDLHELIDKDLNTTLSSDTKNSESNLKQELHKNTPSSNNLMKLSDTQVNKGNGVIEELNSADKPTTILDTRDDIQDSGLTQAKDLLQGNSTPNVLKDTIIPVAITDTKEKTHEIVSTSDLEKLPSATFDNIVQQNEKPNLNLNDRSSTPDSTVTANDIIQDVTCKSLPDSTNEVNPDISSTITPTETFEKNSDGHRTENVQQIGSIGNILSILQDKSKIKELLSMLGDVSEQNEKIKKKLEKLSEIVSDDEENNENTQNGNNSNEKNFDKLGTQTELDKDQIEKKNITEVSITEKRGSKKDDNMEQKISLQDGEPENTTDNEQKSKEDDIDKQKDIEKDDIGVSRRVKKASLRRKEPKGKKGKKKKSIGAKVKRVTRSETSNKQNKNPKRPYRELKLLQDDIKEMFMSEDVLNATGIRMCRLAKFVEEKNVEEPILTNPVVVLEKFKEKEVHETDSTSEKIIKKKPGAKRKNKVLQTKKDTPENKAKVVSKHKPGPKSKTRPLNDEVELDNDSNDAKLSEGFTSSDSENESLVSSKSFESSEVLTEVKKKMKRKRGRGGWQSGVIKKRKKVEKTQSKQAESSLEDSTLIPVKERKIPDMNCFTDKSYCFLKNVSTYPCRLCEYSGNEIVHHYKSCHPHSEIPLSRMNTVVAREAIEQCDLINFQTISKVPTDKYVCRFCFKEFTTKRKSNVLEGFFWHVVSTHTGEYKQLCSECVNVTRCPFNLDIPPPPKDVKGQLIGYICGKCNFTQISLENLKTHVIVRHNDEQTAVYTINLAVMNKKAIYLLTKKSELEARTLRSSRSNQSVTGVSDDHSDITETTEQLSEVESVKCNSAQGSELLASKSTSKPLFKSKISFETDDNTSENSAVKDETNREDTNLDDSICKESNLSETNIPETLQGKTTSTCDDVLDHSHFKISFTKTGNKEYICCINGNDNHYKTSLLISMKKHVQTKHSETWDGYCSICKLIVTSQGKHNFKECLQHLLDKHIDDIPILEPILEEHASQECEEITGTTEATKDASIEKSCPAKPKINVRPLSQLLSTNVAPEVDEEPLAKINETISVSTPTIELPLPSPNRNPAVLQMQDMPTVILAKPTSSYQPQKYEEAQAEVMAKKHQVVLETMMSRDKLVKVFKCAGKFCYFTSDNLEDSLLHASTHQRIGGENALLCSYCDFDCHGNGIDLVMHVFKSHASCQYVCSSCFYRAASSQLVRAHAIRVHGEQCASTPVLKTETFTPKNDEMAGVIPREVAVQQYVCANVKDVCKFKTYTQGKFCEHLDRHQPPFVCYICSNTFPMPIDLVKHLKSHGLKVLQCTWCVHGADNDEEFLAHASSKHPNKQPQGYFRVITSQEASKVRVLPLVQYNKVSIQTEVITSSAERENPVREAERALELEKLISLVKENTVLSTSESQASHSAQTVVSSVPETTAIAITSLTQEPQPVTPETSTAKEPSDLGNLLKSLLKTEPADNTSKENMSDIILLDSDEEDVRDSQLPTIDLSSEDALSKDQNQTNTDSSEAQKIPFNSLYKCSNCQSVYRTLFGFKKHIQIYSGSIKCAHCSLEFTLKEDLLRHYEEDHRSSRDLPSRTSKTKTASSSPQKVFCSKCKFEHKHVNVVKEHMKVLHGESNLTVKSKLNADQNVVLEVVASNTPKNTHKRKLSMGSDIAAKKKRYGPEDVDQLPAKPILDDLVYCALCEFNSKVRINVVRHLQGHADKQPVAQTVPVNPVPHLETNEKHFDKMVNLASSSIITRAHEKPTKVDTNPALCIFIPPEAASRYPKFVSERQRHTCGAKGCSYISVDEDMLKCHWETLHGGCHEFHCVHCPPYQHLDTSRPLTAARIIVHLRMHDANLYACSSCTYYHYKKEVVEKHLNEIHKGSGQVLIVREEYSSPPMNAAQPSTSTTPSAPTMDLKPWQCGLCKYKNMLRQEVVEHCCKVHNSKMQFKCPNCPFRTSTFHNVTKHLSNSHPTSKEEVIYYYYREGSIGDEPDGSPRWMKQRQKLGLTDSEIKTEVDPPPVETPVRNAAIDDPPSVDLDIVKKEVPDPENEESTEELCKLFGSYCDPNGLKYKCPLCKVVNEATVEDMQSHLFEELKYRKWGCSICSYKAFHKTGLKEHMVIEHRQNRDPIELPLDTKIEKWVMELLAHQSALIEKTKTNFTKQLQNCEKPCLYPGPSTSSTATISTSSAATISCVQETSPEVNVNTEELIQAFGELGASEDLNYCCPKCDFKTKEEGKIRDHLESELNKIRWRCSNCNGKFQDYHDAQLHCRTIHFGQSSRPIEAMRDPSKRAAWVMAVMQIQKGSMPAKVIEAQDRCSLSSMENSLLVVRYEEKVPTPEEQMRFNRKKVLPNQSSKLDSDDEKLIIDEFIDEKKKADSKNCPYCDLSVKYASSLEMHLLRHFNLKPYTCGICDITCYGKTMKRHNEIHHPNLPNRFYKTPIPEGPPLNLDLKVKKGTTKPKGNEEVTKEEDASTVICLVCEKSIPESETLNHCHDKQPSVFRKKGDIIVKCCNCLALVTDETALQKHHHIHHSNAKVNYAYFKLHYDTREVHCCGYCDKTFKFLRDLKSHHLAVHKDFNLKYTMKPFSTASICNTADNDKAEKRKSDEPPPPVKRVAKKSTTKLPNKTVAKKSTTKLPFDVDSDKKNEQEYSYYGTKPTSLDELDNVTTLMPFYNNTMMSVTVKKLSELIKINPKVVVKDIDA